MISHVRRTRPARRAFPVLLLLATLGPPTNPAGIAEAAFFASTPGTWVGSALPVAGVLTGEQAPKASSVVGLREAQVLSSSGALANGGGGDEPAPPRRQSAGPRHPNASRPLGPRDPVRFDRDDEAVGSDRAEDPKAGAAPFSPASFGTWRRVYVASLHTKPNQQGRAFQLTLPDPWATGCYAVDVGAASFSELHRDFRLEIFAAEECQGGGGGGPAMLLPPPPVRSDLASLQTTRDAVGARDESLHPHGGRADRTRGNFPGPLRVRSVRFQRLP